MRNIKCGGCEEKISESEIYYKEYSPKGNRILCRNCTLHSTYPPPPKGRHKLTTSGRQLTIMGAGIGTEEREISDNANSADTRNGNTRGDH